MVRGEVVNGSTDAEIGVVLMGLTRRIGALLAGVLLLLAGMVISAPAAQAIAWEPYTTNSNWHCGAPVQHRANSSMVMNTCVVYSAGGGTARSALIVENEGPSALYMDFGSSYLYQNGFFRGGQTCDGSYLSGGYSRACFGAWVSICGQGTFWAEGILSLSGYDDEAFSYLRPAC